MTVYQYRPRAVTAHQYHGEHLSTLPSWVQTYQLKAPGPYGNSAVGVSATHDLLIPTRSGVITVQKTDWIVLEGDRLFAVSDRSFGDIFVVAPLPGADNMP